MVCRALIAVLLVCAVHPSFAAPKAQDQVQVVRGPDIIVEEKPQVIVQNVPIVQTQTIVENVLVPIDEHIGCFRDNGVRDLPHLAHSGSNSVQLCANACRRLGFKFAGVQYSQECWCGQSYGRYGAADNCNMKCTSDSNQMCGGTWANNVYRVGLEPPKPEGPLGYFGCFRDNGNRDMPRLIHSGPQSIESCKIACKNGGFRFAGVQYSHECWCGNSFGRYGKADNCNMKCSGNHEQICGGTWANGVYVAGVSEASDPSQVGLRGCFRDNGDRDLPRLAHSGSNSVQICKNACQNLGFKYAGVQYSHECWCGNFYNRYGKADNCNMKCSGRIDQICGGTWANTVYRLEGWVAPQPEGPFGHFGCFRDNGNRDLPRLAHSGSNSIELCTAACKNLGFKYAGVQYTGECWCGNFFGKYGKADNCNMKCSANSDQICGGAWANNVYLAGGFEDPQPEEPLGYYGCFRDNGVRDLPQLAHSGSNSVELCKAACTRLGFKFAGVQYTGECWCGNFFGKYGKADNCNMRCSANAQQMCGGTWANSVYRASP